MSILIHDSQPSIFIHIPKTAGRSIIETLQRRFTIDVIPNHRTKNLNYHSTIQDAEDFVGDLTPYYCFSIVRNPWDRIGSWFNFRKHIVQKSVKKLRKGMIPTKVSYTTLEEAEKEFKAMELGLYEWLVEYKDRPWDKTWFSPTTNQYDWIRDKKIDKIIKYENLQQEIDQLEMFQGLELQKLNVSTNKKTSYQNLYNKDSIQLVSKIYQEDIERFEYTFN